jgi:hypothetical protein
MRQALELWDMARNEHVEALSRYIQWVTPHRIVYDSNPDREPGETPEPPYMHVRNWIATEEVHPELLQRFRPGNVIQPALYRVQQVLNEHLKGRVSPRMLWDPQFVHLGLYFVPDSLLGALWLQFAQAIDANKDYRRCRECGKWFVLSPETARTNKLFCSNACRSKAYRKRQVEAQRLYAEGVPIEKIADKLGSDLKTVRSWVTRDQT